MSKSTKENRWVALTGPDYRSIEAFAMALRSIGFTVVERFCSDIWADYISDEFALQQRTCTSFITQNPYAIDLFPVDRVLVFCDGDAKWLSEFHDVQLWKDSLQSGEFLFSSDLKKNFESSVGTFPSPSKLLGKAEALVRRIIEINGGAP